jgi:hypothetical protein
MSQRHVMLLRQEQELALQFQKQNVWHLFINVRHLLSEGHVHHKHGLIKHLVF